MSGYFITLLIASVCGGICSVLASGGFEKYIKYISALCCVCLMLVPLAGIEFDSLSDEIPEIADMSVPETSVGLYPIAAEMTEHNTENYINEIVFNQFGIKPVYSDIKIDWAPADPIVQDITVALAKNDMPNAEAIERFLNTALGGEVNVVEHRSD